MTLTDRILESTGARYARNYFAAIHEMFVAKVRDDRATVLAARADLAETMRETLGTAEILGARMALAAAGRAGAKMRRGVATHQFAEQTLVPNVTFAEALEDFVTRAPVTLQNAAERTAQRIAELYSTDRVVAFARSAEETVTREAQAFIARAFRTGLGENRVGAQLAATVNEIREQSAAWSEGYARMVFRTNVNTAVTAGRFRQTRDPDVRAVVPAFRFDAVGDGDTRDNHGAADGMILRVDHPAWGKIAPPLGYNCRCQVVHVSALELDALGKLRDDGTVIDDTVPAGAFPDDGFRHSGRPDLFLTGLA